eukprot:127941_1
MDAFVSSTIIMFAISYPLVFQTTIATSLCSEGDLDTLNNMTFYSLYTDGTQQRFANTAISIPQFPEIVGSSPRTYCLSAQFDDYDTKTCLLSTGSPSISNAFNIVKYTSSLHIGVMGYADDFYPVSGALVYDRTDWNHYCVTYDGTYITIYVNGEIDNVGTNPSLSTAPVASQDNYIGKSNHLGRNPFYGLIRNVRLFSTVLTQTNIQLLSACDTLNPTAQPTNFPSNQPTKTTTNEPTPYPTKSPTTKVYLEYIDALVSCNNLHQSVGIEYNKNLSECMECCGNRKDCAIFNYFEDFKQINDSRCYIFDTLCDISIDNER